MVAHGEVDMAAKRKRASQKTVVSKKTAKKASKPAKLVKKVVKVTKTIKKKAAPKKPFPKKKTLVAKKVAKKSSKPKKKVEPPKVSAVELEKQSVPPSPVVIEVPSTPSPRPAPEVKKRQAIPGFKKKAKEDYYVSAKAKVKAPFVPEKPVVIPEDLNDDLPRGGPECHACWGIWVITNKRVKKCRWCKDLEKPKAKLKTREDELKALIQQQAEDV